VISLTPIRSRIRYEMRSFPQFQAASGANPEDLALALRLPRGVNPRSLALAREWRESLADNSAIVRRAIEFFPRQPLRVHAAAASARPELRGRVSVRHEAGILRALRFEFRVSDARCRRAHPRVTGYQGGDTNPVDGYMVVRQADAHAWAEVWLAGNGWTRVDQPPQRSRSESSSASRPRRRQERPCAAHAHQSQLAEGLRNNWEALTNQWNQWVLGYNPIASAKCFRGWACRSRVGKR